MLLFVSCDALRVSGCLFGNVFKVVIKGVLGDNHCCVAGSIVDFGMLCMEVMTMMIKDVKRAAVLFRIFGYR